VRLLVVTCLLLAGCGQGQFFSPEKIAERQAIDARLRTIEASNQARYAASPQGQAQANCRTKVQFAMAAHRPSSIVDLEGFARSEQLMQGCMDYWQRTGQMP
jgi:hypothetical protein